MNLIPWPKSTNGFRQYLDRRNGSITVYLTPSQQDTHRAAKVEISKVRADKIDDAALRRDERLKIAKETYEAVKKDADEQHRKTVAEADAAFDKAEHELDAKAVAPLSAEQIALMTTPVGAVVRVPDGVPA